MEAVNIKMHVLIQPGRKKTENSLIFANLLFFHGGTVPQNNSSDPTGEVWQPRVPQNNSNDPTGEVWQPRVPQNNSNDPTAESCDCQAH